MLITCKLDWLINHEMIEYAIVILKVCKLTEFYWDTEKDLFAMNKIVKLLQSLFHDIYDN